MKHIKTADELEQEYIPFTELWYVEMNKFTKKELIELLRKAYEINISIMESK